MSHSTISPDEVPQGYKRCKRCGDVLPANLEHFGPVKNVKSKLSAQCRACLREYGKVHTRQYRERIKQDPEQYKTFKEKDRQVHREGYWKDPDKMRERDRANRRNYPERAREYDRKKREKEMSLNPERVRARSRRYYYAHWEQNKERNRIRLQVKNLTPEQLEQKRERARRRRALLFNAKGHHTQEDIELIYRQQKGHCWWCGVELGNAFDVDHRIPLSVGGSDNPDNLVVSCVHCNRSRGNRLPHEWNGRLL